MNIDHEEIREMPQFEHDLDDYTLSAFKSESDVKLAKSISKMRREIRWIGEKVLIAHNLSIKNARFIQRYGPFIALVFTLAGAAVLALVQAWAKSKL